MKAPRSRNVLVWRDSWLPYSQTFVLDHIQTLDRYSALPAGLVVSSPTYDGIVNYRAYRSRDLGRHHKIAFKAGGFRSLSAYLSGESGVEIVHAHFGTGAARILPAVQHAGLPLIVTFHGFDVLSLPYSRLKGSAYLRELRRVFAYASALLPVSNHLQSALLDLGAPEEKVKTHYLGTSVVPALCPLPFEDRVGILFVGRLIPYKGGMQLLQGVASRPELRSVPITIAGEGPERESMEAYSKAHSLTTNFLGSVDHDTVVSLMDSHRVFSVPSHRHGTSGPEAFGLVFAEAAMRGLPVCSINEGGLPEVVAHGVTGLLSSRSDTSQLGANISAIYFAKHLWEQYSAAAISMASRKFDICVQSRALETIYDSL